MRGRLNVELCSEAVIEGICIEQLENWYGLRLHLELNVARLERSKVSGIRVSVPAPAPMQAAALEPAAPVALSPKQLQPLLSGLAAGMKKAPEEVRACCQQKISELQAELLKGGLHDDTAVAHLIDDLLTLLPSLGPAVLKMFGTALLRGLVGPVTQFVLDKLQKD